jgi:hypothetical protein
MAALFGGIMHLLTGAQMNVEWIPSRQFLMKGRLWRKSLQEIVALMHPVLPRAALSLQR